MGASFSLELNVKLILVVPTYIDGIVSYIRNQADEVNNLSSTVRGDMSKLDTWLGPDADAFRNKVQTVLVKELQELINTILRISKGVDSGKQCMLDGDLRAMNEANKLEDIYKQIF